MPNKTIFFVFLSFAGLWLLIFCLKKQAQVAREASDKLMRDFKTIDNSLRRSGDSSWKNKADTILFNKSKQ